MFFVALSDKFSFDLIVSNPPYVAETELVGLQREVRDHEPREALAGGPDGLDVVRRLLIESSAFLKARGHLLIEIGFNQAEAVKTSSTNVSGVCTRFNQICRAFLAL